MSLSPAEWVYRTDGSNLNGGGIKKGYTGSNYSNQAAPYAALTNISSDVAGTTITDDDTGGLITVGAAVQDNFIYIAATGTFTAGWYQIVARVTDNSFTIDRSAGSSKSGGEGNIGGSFVEPTTALYNMRQAHDTSYIQSGNYNLGASVSSIDDGTTTTGRIITQGFTTTPGDRCEGSDRPVIILGAVLVYYVDNYNLHNSVEFTSARLTTAWLKSDINAVMINCKMTNTGVGTIHSGSLSTAASLMMMRGCEITVPNATALTNGGIYATNSASIVGCYLHDIGAGSAIKAVGNTCKVELTTIDTVDTGIEVNQYNCHINNVTIYNAAVVGVDINAGICLVENSVFDLCLLGVSGHATYPSYLDYNNMTNNTADTDANADLGPNTTTNAPGFPDAGAGELTGEDLSADDSAPWYIFGTAGTPLVQGAGQPAAGGGSETAVGFAC